MGFKEATGKIMAVTDDQVLWPDGFLKNSRYLPLQNPWPYLLEDPTADTLKKNSQCSRALRTPRLVPLAAQSVFKSPRSAATRI